jgi:electron transfer flavoprotein alpha subunit
MAGNVWVAAEVWRGEVSDVTYEILSLGREIADGLGVGLDAVLFGDADAAATLAADSILLFDDPRLAEASGQEKSGLIATLAAERSPAAILLPITNATWEVLGLLPARTGGSFMNFCSDAAIVDGRLQVECLLYGGKMNVTAAPLEAPAILAVLPGTRSPDAGRAGGAAPVEVVALEAPEETGVRFLEYVDPEAGGVDITKEDVLVAVGRGLQSDANLDLAEELAELLGGAVCGSRPAIDQGWLPLSTQVGKSGHKVKPKLYIALGISGAPEHLEGMRDAELIVAINTDPDAPIFGAAHYGITEDLLDVVPELIEQCAKTQGG